MVSDSTAGHNLIETRPALFLLMGQIPGTTHLSCNDLVNYWTNEAKPTHEVQTLLEQRSVDLQKPIYITCGWGVTVCMLEAALQSIPGTQCKIFDGSYVEYADKIKNLN